MRRVICLIVVGAVAAVPGASAARVSPGAVPEASSHVAKRCGVIAGGKYRVRARVARCRFSRKWARGYLRTGATPRGYSCSRPGHGIAMYCRKGARQYWAEVL